MCDEDRRVYYTLGPDEDDLPEGDLRWVLGWTDLRGWFLMREAAPQEALGSHERDLPVPLMAAPDEVAKSAAPLWVGEGQADLGPHPGVGFPDTGWSPPSGYVPDPEVSPDPLDEAPEREAALLVYLKHPAYLRYIAEQRKEKDS